MRSILFCPEQIDIIRGAPDVRRKFLDRAHFIADPTYLTTARNYIQVLRQKRELLKKFNIKKNTYLGDMVISYQFINKPKSLSNLDFQIIRGGFIGVDILVSFMP